MQHIAWGYPQQTVLCVVHWSLGGKGNNHSTFVFGREFPLMPHFLYVPCTILQQRTAGYSSSTQLLAYSAAQVANCQTTVLVGALYVC